MNTLLNKFVLTHPSLTLSYTEYRRHFHLGYYGVNIPSSPTQRLQSFVKLEGSPYRFLVVGQLMSFKVVEDSFGHFMSFNIGQLQTLSDFREMFSAQLETLQNIEEVDRLDKELETQHAEWRTPNDQLSLRAYNLTNYPLSSADIGSFILSVVELRCLDVSCSVSTFSRVYWIEADMLRSLSSHESVDEEVVKKLIDCLGSLNPTVV